ncbi:MAG: N-methylhydantoinase [Gaiellales bacterium]|nr:N-methylhydantoinase [Gaiellales bacterium]
MSATADPITTEIIRNAFISAADEMNATLIRSAYSWIIYEAKDCSVALLDEEKRVLGQSAGLPIFLGNLEICIQLTEDAFGADCWQPGDVWIMNDSYMTGTHLGDVTIFAPIHYDGELAGFSASRAHWYDIGAKDPGGPTDSTEIYQEGLRLGPTKVMEGRRLREDIVDILARNSRLPDLTVGDLHAQIAVARTGERRLATILDRYGVETVKAACEQIFAQSAALDRAAVVAIPNGVYAAEGCLDNDGVSDDPFWVRMTIEVAGDEMAVDLSESSDSARGAINCGEAQTVSACRVAFKRLINPDRPATGGTFAPLKVKVRPGSLLAAEEPAACQWYFTPLGLLIDLFAKALAPVMPEEVAAASHGDSMVLFITGEQNGRQFIHNDDLVGGWGAWDGSDGESCLINSVNGALNDFPIEIVESRYPLRLRRYALRGGSSGAGKWRGGCGTIRELEILSEEAWLSLWYERSKTPAWGLFGGQSGKPPVVEVNPGTAHAKQMLKVNRLPLRRGDIVRCESGGGGGYGDPRERNHGLIEQDLREGVITPAEAQAAYGYRKEEGP